MAEQVTPITSTLRVSPTLGITSTVRAAPNQHITRRVGLSGGRVDFTTDMWLDLPAQAAVEPLRITFGPPDEVFQPYPQVLWLFSLNAEGESSGLPIRQFNQPLTITVRFDSTGLTTDQILSIRINYWNTTALAWAMLPTTVDPIARTVSAVTDHFTDYSVVIHNQGDGKQIVWPQSADVNNFNTDLFGGSANFRYPIQLPPGTGGLSPQLNVVGSSTAAFASRRSHLKAEAAYEVGRQDGGWLGTGFQLDLPYVEKHQVKINDQLQDRYTLSFGGASYKLVDAGSGQYRTESEQFLKITNAGDFWVVNTRDGTEYFFGVTYHLGITPTTASGMYPYPPKLHTVTFTNNGNSSALMPFTWYLSRIMDRSGNEVLLGYDRFRDQLCPGGNCEDRWTGLGYSGGCNTTRTQYDQAVFPVVMTYRYAPKANSAPWNPGSPDYPDGTPHVRVYFNRQATARYDFGAMAGTKLRSEPCIQAFYSDKALDNIEIKVLDGGTERLVRRYQFGYDNGVPLMLTSITETSGAASLPALSLSWQLISYNDGDGDNNYRLPNVVQNGYNGTVSFTYDITQPGATYKDTWGQPPVEKQISLPRVSSRTAGPGGDGGSANVVQNYTYVGGAGNSDPREPEFRGHSKTTVTEGTKVIEHFFLQGLSAQITLLDNTGYTDVKQMAGRPWRTVVWQNGKVLQVVERQYGTAAGFGTPSGSLHVRLLKQVEYAYPSTATAITQSTGRKKRVVTYEYDSYGNVTAERTYDGSSGTDVLLQRIARGFSVNTNAWILNKPFYENIFDAQNVLHSNTAFYYDNNHTPEPNPGAPTTGRLTMLRQLVRYHPSHDLSNSCFNCLRTYYEYDTYGNRTKVTDPRGAATTTSYDATATFPTAVTFPLIGTATAAWDGGLGKPTNQTDVNGRVTSYEYDSFGRLRKVAQPGNTLSAPTVEVQYTDTPSLVVTRIQRVNASTSRTTKEFYDGFGRIFLTKVQDTGNQYATSFQDYDASGRVYRQSVPIFTTTDQKENPSWGQLIATIHSYDGLDRPTAIQAPGSGTTVFSYDGWVTGIVDANSHCRSSETDALGQVVKVTTYGGTYQGPGNCGTARNTTYSYDAAGRLTVVRNAVGTSSETETRMWYDLAGRKLALDDPDLGTWAYGYDANGNLVTQIDARGQVVFSVYDALNRLTQVRTGNAELVSASQLTGLRTIINDLRSKAGVSAYSWQSPASLAAGQTISAATYTELRTALQGIPYHATLPQYTAGAIVAGRPVRLADLVDLHLWTQTAYTGTSTLQHSYGYDAGADGKGRRTSLTDPVGSTSFSYDQRGRLTNSTRVQGGLSFAVTTTYNDANEPVTVSYPDGEVLTTGYSLRGVPNSLSSSTGGSRVSNVVTDPLGRPTTISFAGGTQQTFSYDAGTTRLTRIIAPSLARSYGYDAVGNVSCLDPAGAQPCTTGASGVQAFSYDARDQLTSMTIGGAVVNAYAYDSLHRITSKVEANTSVSLVYNTSKPVHAPSTVNGTIYSYDANGNLTSRGTTSYTYDWANRLVTVVQPSGTTEYRYDADGTLVQRVDSSGTTHLIGELYERAPTGTITKRYSLGSRLIGSSVGGAFTFVYADYLNSTVSAGNGATTEYTPFGLVRTSSGTLPTNRQFQGQQHESAVGLYKMGARWYDPAVGLWTQPDTIVPNPLNPQDYHRYAFVRNNPLRQVDPTGHNPEDPCLIKGICAGEPSTTPNTDDPTGNTACGAGSLNFIDCALRYLYQTQVVVCFSGWYCVVIDVGAEGWGPFTPDDALAGSEIEFEAQSQKVGSLKLAKGNPKYPKPPLPPGVTDNEMFGNEVMKWGRFNEAARARIKTLTREELEQWGVTLEIAQEWRDFYVVVMRDNPRNPSAAGRAELMQRAIELLSTGR